MKNYLLIKVLLLLTVIVILLAGGSLNASDYVPGELLVKYRAGNYPTHLQGELRKIGWAKIKTDRNKTMQNTMEELKKRSDVIQIELNTYGQFLTEPNDPSFGNQWYLPAIRTPEAWNMSLGAGAIIALVDSGVNFYHEDLAENILPGGWDFGDNDDDPSDELGHGTQVCGVMAAVQNNNLGISGVAPQSMILPIKISQGSTGTFTDETVATGIIYAADNGAAVINLSLGWNDGATHQLITDAVTYAADKGVTLVAAAGNSYGPVWFPAKLERVLAVSAIDSNDQNTSSAYGPELDLVAPGSGSTINDFILTTSLGGGYSYVRGTSFSSAIVSGVAALVNEADPLLNAEQLREHLVLTADDLGAVGKDDLYGYGKVNAYNAVCSVNQPDTYPPQGNNCGDACECEGNFDGDQDQDGTDAFNFRQQCFGRSILQRPCINADPCNGDFTCDGDCDGSDAFIFKFDFGRSSINSPCPYCVTVPWCSYCQQPSQGLYDDFNDGTIDFCLWRLTTNHDRIPIEANGTVKFVNETIYPETTDARLDLRYDGYNWIETKLKLASGSVGQRLTGIQGRWFAIDGNLTFTEAQIESIDEQSKIAFRVAETAPPWNEIFREEIPASLDVWYNLKIEFTGSLINFYVDGMLRSTYNLPMGSEIITGTYFFIESWTYINSTIESYADNIYVGY